jgi:hypothetical protein
METVTPQHQRDRRGADRRARRSWVWRERRSGFDRRSRSASRWGAAWDEALIYLRDNPLALVAMLALANLLSLLDLMFTLRALDHGAVEANPVMRALLEGHPAAAVIVKVCLVAGVSVVVFLLRRYRLMLKVAILALVLFAVIVMYHFYGAIRLT